MVTTSGRANVSAKGSHAQCGLGPPLLPRSLLRVHLCARTAVLGHRAPDLQPALPVQRLYLHATQATGVDRTPLWGKQTLLVGIHSGQDVTSLAQGTTCTALIQYAWAWTQQQKPCRTLATKPPRPPRHAASRTCARSCASCPNPAARSRSVRPSSW